MMGTRVCPRTRSTKMAFDIEEVDEPKLTKGQWILLMAKASNKDIGTILNEEEQRKAHEEFWSDPCWSE